MSTARPGVTAGEAIALGWVPNASYVAKFGRNTDVDAASAAEDIWNGGGLYTGFPTGSAETVTVVSASAADTAAGTGLRTLRMVGTDADGNLQTEDITLNGTSAVTSVKQWYRMNRAFGLTAGSGGVNAGEITIRHSSTTANIFAVMPTGAQTQIAAYTVLAEKQGLLRSISAACSNAAGSTAEVTVGLLTRAHGSDCWRTRETAIIATDGGRFVYGLDGGILLDARTDVVVRVLTATADNISVSTRFEVFQFDM